MNMRTSLILDGDAKGLVLAAQSAVNAFDALEARSRATGQGMKSAEASAQVFSRAILEQRSAADQLMSSVDPLQAANARLEGSQKTLSDAHSMGALSTREYQSALSLLEAKHIESVSAIQGQTTAQLALTNGLSDVSLANKSAEASAAAFTAQLEMQERSLEQLRASINPLYAANRRFEASQETLNNAHRSGMISTQEYRRTLDLLEAQHRQTTSAIEMQADSTRRLTWVTRGGAGGMQNFSYQLQDIFTQVGMGVPLMISLGQQAPQILSGFGSIGAMAGVAAAAILPLSAAIFDLGYQTAGTREKVVTDAERIQEALSAIGEAQSRLRENSVTNLDEIAGKYGEVTVGVLTLMQAMNDLAVQEAMRATQSALEPVLTGGALADLERYAQDRQDIVNELQREIASIEAFLPLTIDTATAERQIADLRADLDLYAAGADVQLDFGIDQATMQEVLIFQTAIEDALAAENYDGLLDVVTNLRTILQAIPDGPLAEMLGDVVGVEDALRQALAAGEDNEEIQRSIQSLLETNGSIDVSSNIAAGADQATRMANELGRAVSNAIALANQGVGAADRARINYEFRDDPIGRAGALAGAEFDARTPIPAGADSTIVNVIEGERREFVRSRVEAARYTEQLQAYRREQRELNRSARSGARGAARDRERLMRDVERQIDRLAPSYARDRQALEEWRDEALTLLNPAAAGYEDFAADVEMVFEERLAEAYRADLARREDWASGIERGLLDVNDEMMSWADVGQNLATEWSSGMEDAFVNLRRTGKLEIGDLVDYTIDQFTRLAYQATIQPGVDGLFDFLTDAISGAVTPNATATVTQSHAGSTIGAGGVRRTYGTGAPLRPDERLTVTTLGQRVFTPEQISNGATVVDALAAAAQRPGGGAPVTFAPNFIIENNSSAEISQEVREEDDGRGGRQFRMIFSDRVASSLSDPGSGARKTLRKTYGVQQVRARR